MDLNAPLYEGQYFPLILAAESMNPDLVAWMPEHGADPNGRIDIPDPIIFSADDDEPESLSLTAMDAVQDRLSHIPSPEEAEKLNAIRALLLRYGARQSP